MHVSGWLGPWAQGHPFCFLGSLGVQSAAFHRPGSFQALGRLLLYLLWSQMGSQISEKNATITKKHGLCLFTFSRIQDTVWVPV